MFCSVTLTYDDDSTRQLREGVQGCVLRSRHIIQSNADTAPQGGLFAKVQSHSTNLAALLVNMGGDAAKRTAGQTKTSAAQCPAAINEETIVLGFVVRLFYARAIGDVKGKLAWECTGIQDRL